jgi:tetratricopeptide (TPR) repeat protein
MKSLKISITTLVLCVGVTGVAVGAARFFTPRETKVSRGVVRGVDVPAAATAGGIEATSYLSRRAEARRYWRDGANALSRKNYATAESTIRKGLALDPASLDKYLLLGRACEGLGKHDEALLAYRQVVRPREEVDSPWARDAATLLHYAQLNARRGNMAEADWACGRAFANPTSSLATYTVHDVPILNLVPPFQGTVVRYPDFEAVVLIARAVGTRSQSLEGTRDAVGLLAQAQSIAKSDQTQSIAAYLRADTLALLWASSSEYPKDRASELTRLHEGEKIYMEAARLDRGRGLLRPFLLNRLPPLYIQQVYGKGVTREEVESRSACFQSLGAPKPLTEATPGKVKVRGQ